MEIENNPLTESSSPQAHPYEYLTREQVAELLQVSTSTVSDMTVKGILIAIKLGGAKNSTLRYRRQSLDESLKRLEGW